MVPVEARPSEMVGELGAWISGTRAPDRSARRDAWRALENALSSDPAATATAAAVQAAPALRDLVRDTAAVNRARAAFLLARIVESTESGADDHELRVAAREALPFTLDVLVKGSQDKALE